MDLASTPKLWLYHHFWTTNLSWFLLNNNVTLTLVQELQAIALIFLKFWAGLPRCANRAVLSVGERNRFGLCTRDLELFESYVQQHIRLSLLHSSTNHRCKARLEFICKSQGSWTKKFPLQSCFSAPKLLFNLTLTLCLWYNTVRLNENKRKHFPALPLS